MKSIKNGDVLTFGDKIFLAVKGQLVMVETVTKKEFKTGMNVIKKVLNTPIDGDQYNAYSILEAIFNGKSWIVKETPAKAKLTIKDVIKKGNE